MSGTMLDHALEYLREGRSVIPVGHGDKRPHAGFSWKPYQSRRPTEAEVRSWWERWPDSSVAMVTGRVSGISVVDVDRGGDLNAFPVPTPIVSTGGGGWHLWYAHADGVTNALSGRFPHVDVRGEGGYVILPPSSHPSGRRYEWSFRDIEPLPFPVHLFGESVIGAGNAVGSWEDDLSRGVGEGGRDNAAVRLAGKWISESVEPSWEREVWPRLVEWNRRNDPPLPEAQLRKCYDSVCRKHRSSSSPVASPQERPAEMRRRVTPAEMGARFMRTLAEAESMDVVSFGYPPMDERLVGLLPGELAVVTGSTGLGKTTFCLNVMRRNAASGVRGEIVALESTLDEYAVRHAYFRMGQMIRSETSLDADNFGWRDFRLGRLRDDPTFRRHADAFMAEMRSMGDTLGYMEQDGGLMSVSELLDRIRWLSSEHGVRLMLVDHLHYFNLISRGHSKADFIESTMTAVKQALIETGMSMLLVAHVRKGNGRKVGFEDLKDSVSIPQVADHVVVIDRPRGMAGSSSGYTEFRVEKTRSIGGEVTFSAVFDPATGDYSGMALGTQASVSAADMEAVQGRMSLGSP